MIHLHHPLLRQAEVKHALLNWWEAMTLPPEQLKRLKRFAAPTARRAQLRRCDNPEAVMLTEGFRTLWQALPEKVQESPSEQSMLAWACIVGTLAYAENQVEPSFASSLGLAKDGTDKSVVSELRFQALQQAKSPDELFRRLRRVLQQLNRSVNVLSLADDVLCWFEEQSNPSPLLANTRLSVRWAIDYYKAAPQSN